MHISINEGQLENILVECVDVEGHDIRRSVISVPNGYEVVVVRQGRKIGNSIGPCVRTDVTNKMNFTKDDVRTEDLYSFYFVTNNAQLLTYKWGVGGQTCYDNVLKLLSRYGAHGNYILSIKDPILLYKAIKPNSKSILKEDLEVLESNTIFKHVTSKVASQITSFIEAGRVSVLNVAKDVETMCTNVKNAFNDDSVLSQNGLSFRDISIEIHISEEEERKIREVLERRDN